MGLAAQSRQVGRCGSGALAVMLGLVALLLGRSVDASPLDRVVGLRSGETVRGRLVAEVPGQYLLLQIGSEFRRIAWSELQPPESPEGPNPRTISIVVESDKSMELASKPRRAEASDGPREWQPLCEIPCQRSVPRHDLFRLSGPGLDSAEFDLPELGPRALVKVRPGYRGLIPLGAMLLAVGSGAFVGGLTYMILTFFGGYEIGAPLLLGGTIGVIAGGVMVAKGQTRVDVEGIPASDVALRLPTRRPIYLTARGLVF